MATVPWQSMSKALDSRPGPLRKTMKPSAMSGHLSTRSAIVARLARNSTAGWVDWSGQSLIWSLCYDQPMSPAFLIAERGQLLQSSISQKPYFSDMAAFRNSPHKQDVW
ncbi:hypothetical protein FOCG_14119 [Fusarium oxysporum f. sp. radicis-lycopersici 26381]|uniref:Uncharacterized protein n=1 Tax=Fusarium oxysporum Fo47 TaxID=660027 RepID=W9L502_FUSOX|nr:hypothetical protein FOZG_01731 [Fusarium oxysporum Fo47]EWZ87174.1 hypothetical protein FOWG_10562 [Fusarium oxysporum f. sp. lycopersici MN25]EXL43826.1 hypothetical protein FOCG_14119 [Fusarium oxysporum f. sp. radicis-lycopersici 26381]